jgi:hypothetical protein
VDHVHGRLLQCRCFGGLERALVLLPPERPSPTDWLARLGQLQVLADIAAGRVHAALVREGDEHTRHGAPVGGHQIQIALHRREAQTRSRVKDRQDALQIGRLSGESIKVVHDDATHGAGFEVLQHPFEGRSAHLRLEGGDVVVDVRLSHLPAAYRRDGLTVSSLSTYPRARSSSSLLMRA